ncbi:MAG: hypothetical protein KC503_01975 [Myxococcales bacterium]|nr:hypothetical protein [Myxococcales bacterium]
MALAEHSVVSTRSAILQLLSAFAPPDSAAAMPVATLLAGTRVLGINENAARVQLARLKSDGLVETPPDERGRYRLGEAARAINAQVAGWRDIERRVCAWDEHSFIAVHTSGLGRSDRRALARRERALAFVGFRALRKGLFVRPQNLVGGVAQTRARLHELGLPTAALVAGLDALDERSARAARALWRDDDLDRRYARALEALADSSERLPAIPLEQAAREAFIVGGAAIRLIVFDPLLPAPIVDASKRRALVAAMTSYDKLGRRLWTSLLVHQRSSGVR